MAPTPRFLSSTAFFLVIVMAGSGSAEPLGGERAGFISLVLREAGSAGVPADIADAVMAIESGYDPARIGSVGEIGLMQIRPETARMLGFTGSPADLARPEINIHYGVTYLAGAWRQADGDLCRALMKYRSGHSQEVMTPRSTVYCGRAKAHLAAAGPPYAGAALPTGSGSRRPAGARQSALPTPERDLRLRGAAFWAAHDARVKAISASIERRWKRIATR